MSPTETEARLTDRMQRLADYAATRPTRSLDARTVVLLDLEPVRRRSRIPATVAAGVVAVAVIGSVVVVAESSDTGPRAGVTATAPSGQSLSFDQGPTAPDVELTGWTTTTSTLELVPPATRNNELFMLLYESGQLTDGPHVKIGITAPPETYSAGPNPTPVDINGVPGEIGTLPDGRVVVTWSPASGRVIYLDAQHTSADDVITIARGLHFTGDLAAVTTDAATIPDGFVLANAAHLVTEIQTAAEYKFERDGMLFQVNLYPGGRDTFDERRDDAARPVTVRGLEGAISSEDGKHYKLLLADGRWAAEIAGGPFVSEQAFLEAVDGLVVAPAG